MEPIIVTERLTLDVVPKDVRERIQSIGVVEEPVLIRKRSIALETDDDFIKASSDFQIEENERAAIRYVSTRHVDRDKEILMPEGCILDEFLKAPSCLWGHNYSLPPIGSDQWIKTYPKRNPIGILAKTIYAETPRAEEVFQLVKAGHLRTSSVGFIPVESVRVGDNGWHELMEKLKKKWPEFKPDDVRRIYTKWILLEHSDVSVPANPHALTVAVAKRLNERKDILDGLGIDRDQLQREEEELQAYMELFFPDLDSNIERDREKDSNDMEENEDEEKWFDYDEVMKPYPNEHACRLNDPDKYSAFRRNNNRFGSGIHAIFGRRKSDGKSELQAIRFDKTKFTVAQAKAWLKDHNHKCMVFEPASNRDLVVEVLSKSEPLIIVERKEETNKQNLNEQVDLIIGRMKGKV